MPIRSVPGSLGETFVVQAVATGPSGGGPSGTDKPMVSLLNPASSGKKVHVVGFSVQCESHTGTNVIILYELRQITAHSGGTAYTPVKRVSSNAASVAEVKVEPSSVTEVAGPVNMQSYIMQSNTAISAAANFLSFGVVGEQAMCLLEGEGLVAHQVTNNGGDFRIGLVWVETDV